MPFKVTFSIFEPGKKAPCMKTTDGKLARVEYNYKCQQPGMALTRMTYDIECVDLTKPEQYVWLVYCVRQAIKKYYNEGRKKEDLQMSLTLEKQLDAWNTRTRYHLQAHPKCTPDDPKAFAFFQIVDKWRDKWHKFFNAKKAGTDKAVLDQMKKECFDYEAQIDKYVKQVIGLI